MLYKFFFKRTRTVPKEFDTGGYVHKYQEEQVAYSADAYFYALGTAKAYAQRHSAQPIVWEDHSEHGDYYSGTVGDTEFMIFRENAELEPIALQAIPEDFHAKGGNR